jgi:hypothetical protein
MALPGIETWFLAVQPIYSPVITLVAFNFYQTVKNVDRYEQIESAVFWDLMSCSLVEVTNVPKEPSAFILRVQEQIK